MSAQAKRSNVQGLKSALQELVFPVLMPVAVAVGMMVALLGGVFLLGLGIWLVVSLRWVLLTILLIAILVAILLRVSVAMVRIAFFDVLIGLVSVLLASYYVCGADLPFVPRLLLTVLGVAVGLLLAWLTHPKEGWEALKRRARDEARSINDADGNRHRLYVLKNAESPDRELVIRHVGIMLVLPAVSVLVLAITAAFRINWWGLVWGLLAVCSLWGTLRWLLLEGEADAKLFWQPLQQTWLENWKPYRAIGSYLNRFRERLAFSVIRWS